jgi:predicted nucleic acid-binding protein
VKLLDTTVPVDHLRGDHAAVDLLKGFVENDATLVASEVVGVELVAGVRDPELPALEEFSAVSWVSVGEDVAREAGELARKYRRANSRIDDAEYLIAATTLLLEAELPTRTCAISPCFRVSSQRTDGSPVEPVRRSADRGFVQLVRHRRFSRRGSLRLSPRALRRCCPRAVLGRENVPATTLARLIGHTNAGYTWKLYARDGRSDATVAKDVLDRARNAGPAREPLHPGSVDHIGPAET